LEIETRSPLSESLLQPLVASPFVTFLLRISGTPTIFRFLVSRVLVAKLKIDIVSALVRIAVPGLVSLYQLLSPGRLPVAPPGPDQPQKQQPVMFAASESAI